MPTYDYRCKQCGNRFSLFYKSYAAYDRAERLCPNCQSDDLDRIINRIAVQAPTRDYTRMSSGEMLSVFESGDSRQVGEMFQQVGGSSPELGKEYHDATQRLLKGDSLDKVERDLRDSDSAKPAADKGTTDKS